MNDYIHLFIFTLWRFLLILHGCHGNVIFLNSGLFITADRKNLDTRTMFYQKIPVADPYTLLPPGLIILDFAARLRTNLVSNALHTRRVSKYRLHKLITSQLYSNQWVLFTFVCLFACFYKDIWNVSIIYIVW